MIVDESDISRLRRGGVRVTDGKGKPFSAPTPPAAEVSLRDILGAIIALGNKPIPAPQVTVAPAQVTVKPPEVTVHVSPAPAPIFPQPPKPITAWKFTLTKNRSGQTTEIVARALE